MVLPHGVLCSMIFRRFLPCRLINLFLFVKNKKKEGLSEDKLARKCHIYRIKLIKSNAIYKLPKNSINSIIIITYCPLKLSLP